MKKLLLTILFVLPCLLADAQEKKFTGTFSNGYKGAEISFRLSADGKQMNDLTFNGYWRCGGSTEQITAGPEKAFIVKNGRVSGLITEPENGGASAFRFELTAVFAGKQANGTFRMSVAGLSCDTYKLEWKAKTM